MKIAGTAKDAVPIMIRKPLRDSATFEATLKTVDFDVAFLDEVLVEKDGVVNFRGVVETRRPAYDANSQSMFISGRDNGALLSHTILPSTVFVRTEPADVIRSLVRPTLEVSTYTDDFSGATLNFTANRGTWLQQYGLCEALDNQADKFMIATCNQTGAANWTNYIVVCYVCPLGKYNGNRLNWQDTACGVIGAYTAGPNYVTGYLGYNATTGKKTLYLSQITAGVETVIASQEFEWNYLNTYTFALALRGTTATLFVDGLSRLTGTITSPTGKPGMISGGAHCQFDSFFISLTGKTATASINSATAIGAIDADLNTFWSSGIAQANGQWWKLDLGISIANLCRFTIIQHPDNFAKNWKLEYSTNDSTWTEITSKTGEYRSTIEVFFASVTARYFRITLTASDTALWQICEAGASVKDGNQILEFGTINNFGTCLTIELREEDCLAGCFHVAEICGWIFWVGNDGKVNFAENRGTDLSATILFRKGFEIETIKRERELPANSLWVYGHGEGDNELLVKVKNDESIGQYGQIDKTFTESDIVSLGALNARATALLAVWKDPLDKLTIKAVDPYAVGSFETGDTVNVVHTNVGVDGDYLIQQLQRTWDLNAETLNLILSNRKVLPEGSVTEVISAIQRDVAKMRNYPAPIEHRYDVPQVNGLQSVSSEPPSFFL